MMAATLQPNGKGVYVRDNPAPWLDFAHETGCQFVLLNPNARSHREVAAKLGGEMPFGWYALADGWSPSKWEETMSTFERYAGVGRGPICNVLDVEMLREWAAARDAHARMLARAKANLHNVIVTSIPTHIFVEAWAAAGCEGSPQFYLLGELGSVSVNTKAEAIEKMEPWWARWVRAGYRRCGPSVSLGTRATRADRTEVEQRDFLDAVSHATRAPYYIGWSQDLRPPMTAGLRAAWRDFGGFG